MSPNPTYQEDQAYLDSLIAEHKIDNSSFESSSSFKDSLNKSHESDDYSDDYDDEHQNKFSP